MDLQVIFMLVYWCCKCNGHLQWGSFAGWPLSDFKSHTLVNLSVVKEEAMHTGFPVSKQADAVTISFEYQNRSYILDLVQNRMVVGEGALLRYQTNGTQVTKHMEPSEEDQCLYTGTVRGSSDSSVAVSTCGGVSGLVSEPGITLFLSPAPGGEHWLLRQQDLLQYRPARSHLTSGRPTSRRRRRHAAAILRGPIRASPASLYLELVLVLDNHVYRDNGQDLVTVQRRAKQITNILHSVFARLDIFVALVGVDVWTEGDEITLSPNADDTLTNFLHYRRERLSTEMPNDNAQLLTGTKFEGGIVGKALSGMMCTHDNSGGISTDHSKQVSLVAATVAHELGHNLGLEHDGAGCRCDDERCIMSASASSIGPTRWSSCSRSQLARALKHGLGHCLHNKPATPLFSGPVCGNGFVEEGEECDCGLPSDCATPCCDPATCQLKYNGTCASGGCCDLQTCRPRPAGEPCRPERGECDLAEYCNGTSQLCPADVWRLDGLPCRGGQSHCYAGHCATRDDQCRLLWGQSGTSSAPQCYEQNVRGGRGGDCGYSRLNKSFLACQHSDTLCGRLHCAHLNERLEYGVESSAILAASFMNLSGNVVPCRSAVVDLGLRQRDPGLVPQGAPCGSGRMCVDQRCVPVSSVMAGGCSIGCSGRGVCNSRGNCHCDYGWAPPHCAESGIGGSVDSGPNLQSTAGHTVAVVLFVIFLGVVPAAAAVFCCLYCRRHKLSLAQFLGLPASSLPACSLPSLATLRRKLPRTGGAARFVRRPDVPRTSPGKTGQNTYNVRLLVLSGEDELLQPAPSGAAEPAAQSAPTQPASRRLTASLLGKLGSLARPATTDGAGRPSDRLVCRVKPNTKPATKSAAGAGASPAGTGDAREKGGGAGDSGVAVQKVEADQLQPERATRTTFGMLDRQSAAADDGSDAGTDSAADATRRTTFGMVSPSKKAGSKSSGKLAAVRPGAVSAATAGGLESSSKPVSATASARSAFLSGTVGRPAVSSGPPPSRVVTGQVRSVAGTLEKKSSGSAAEKKPTGAVTDKKLGIVDKRPTSVVDKKLAGGFEKKPAATSENKLTGTSGGKPAGVLEVSKTTLASDKKPATSSSLDTKKANCQEKLPAEEKTRVPHVSRSESVPSAAGSGTKESRSPPGQVRFAPDTLERRPAVARSDSAPTQPSAGQEPPRSSSRASTLESGRSDTLRSSGSERDSSLGSTLSRVASVFRRGEKPADPPAGGETGLRPTQSFKAAKLDRDTVRTLGISNPIPMPAGQFSTLPTSPRGRREGRAPVRASSDVGRPVRPVSLLVRPSEPPPRPPNATELYDDCNADWRAGGGCTPVDENIYCTIDEATEERPRPKSMVEPGVLADSDALYQNTMGRRVPWRLVGTRQPSVARKDSAAAARAVKAWSPIAEERTASAVSLEEPVPPTTQSCPAPASGAPPPVVAQSMAPATGTGLPSRQPAASAWSSKLLSSPVDRSPVSLSSAASTETSSGPPKRAETSPAGAAPATAAGVGKTTSSALASKAAVDSTESGKQSASSAPSSKQATTTASSVKQNAVSSPPERQPSGSSMSSKEPRPTVSSAKQSAPSSASSKTSTSSPGSARSARQSAAGKSSVSSAPGTKKQPASALSAKQPTSSASSSKKSSTPATSRPGTLSAASSQQSMSSVSSARSTVSSPSSEKADAAPGKKKTAGSVGKKTGASLSKKVVPGKTEPAEKTGTAGSGVKKAGSGVDRRTGATSTGRTAAEPAEKATSTATGTSSAAPKAGSVATKTGSTAARAASVTAKSAPSAAKSDTSAAKAASSVTRAGSAGTKAATSAGRGSRAAGRPATRPSTKS